MEEEREKILGKTHSSSTISSNDNDRYQSDRIPLDLTIEILSRLPAKSVVRFRSVSKLWSAVTTSHDFINSFAIRSLASRPSVLITILKDNMLLLFSSPLHKDNFDGRPDDVSCVGSYQFPNLNFHRYHYVHGLIFIEGSKEVVVWNPTVKRFFTLPEPEGGTECDRECIVGYNSIEGKYIVLRFLRDSSICMLTLGTQGQTSCRIITNGVPKHRGYILNGRCINGVMYYRVMYYRAATFGFVDRIMSFDVRSEKFDEITYPEGYSHASCYMVPYEGRLAILRTMKFPSIDLCILKDGDRHEWTHKHFVLRPLSEMDPRDLSFYDVSDAGELIFIQGWMSKSFSILYIDPRRNSIREVSFDVGDEFISRYGFGVDHRYAIKVDINHIESLVSL